MAEKKKEASIWWTILKVIFACLLLAAVMNGYFMAGAKSLADKAIGGTHALLSADMLKEGASKK
ncbi:MAG: hypothetical protein J6J27_00080 [Alphaproteobacteria bacterium]|nr:hypothetical protein [Alphaproteobacteria bacterium]